MHGRPELDPNSRGNWGASAMGDGFGIFELLAMCEVLDIEVVLVQPVGGDGEPTNRTRAEDLADMVEYMHGDADTTFGALRVADGHPSPYEVKWFELGNEQYNSDFVAQVDAMETRATQIGLTGDRALHYIWGGPPASFHRPGAFGPNTTDANKADALGLGDRLVVDVHTDGFHGVEAANEVWKAAATSSWSVLNLETNCGTHAMMRGLDEAADLNTFFNSPDTRLVGRTGSFCLERSGYNEGGLNDQGMIFFLPNMTWLQPPAHVHHMVTSTWQPWALNVSMAGSGCSGLSVSAQSSAPRVERGSGGAEAEEDPMKEEKEEDEAHVESEAGVLLTSDIAVRIVNRNSAAVSIMLLGPNSGVAAEATQVSVTTLASPSAPHQGWETEANTPADPAKIAPVTSTWNRTAKLSKAAMLTLPAGSFSVLTYNQ